MRPAIPYSAEELLEFAELQEKTNVAAEELESAFMEIQQNHMLSKREVLFTLARVVDSFIRLEEDYEFDESKRIDAEAIFNDYFLACRDLQESQENDDEPVLDKATDFYAENLQVSDNMCTFAAQRYLYHCTHIRDF